MSTLDGFESVQGNSSGLVKHPDLAILGAKRGWSYVRSAATVLLRASTYRIQVVTPAGRRRPDHVCSEAAGGRGAPGRPDPQGQLARLAHTSRTAVSAHENGRRKPTSDTVERLLSASGLEADLRPRITFHPVKNGRGRTYQVPDQLPSLPLHAALATVELPLALNWSQPGRRYRLKDRSDRARVYEAVLREGGPQDVLTYVDGVLLVDLWDELLLPRDLRAAWAPLISKLTAA